MVQIGSKLGNPDLEAVERLQRGRRRSGRRPNGEKIYDQYEITTTATNKLQTTVTFAAGRPGDGR